MIISLIRAVILYTLIIFAIRLMGKRQIGQLQPGELAITILISNIAVLPIEDINVPLALGAVPILTLVCFELLISILSMKSFRLRTILSGKPIFVIENGKINQKAINSLRFTIDDLMEGLRSCEVFDISQVAYAIVETNGTMSVIKKFPSQNVTAQMLKLQNQQTTIPLVIVSDGKVVNDNLKEVGLTKKWLLNELQKENINANDIFIMTADTNKNTFITLKENVK